MTPKWKAKRVEKLEKHRYKKYVYFRKILDFFETEDGKKFKYACNYSWKYGIDYNEKTKFYVCRYSGEHKSVEYRYRIYEIPWHQAITRPYKDYPNYVSMLHVNDGFFVVPK